MKKKFISLCLFVMCLFLLSGCMQVTNNIRIFKDGSYQSELEIYVPSDIYDNDPKVKSYLDELINLKEGHYTRLEKEIEIDDLSYHYIVLSEDRESNTNPKIKISIEDDEVLLTHSFKLDDDLFYDFDALDIGDDYKQILKDLGISIIERIQMPGAIISANCGVISDDILTVDVISDDVITIIVRSNISSGIENLFILFIVVSILLVALIIIYLSLNKKTKNKNKVSEPEIKIEKENLIEENKNDVLDTIALEEKEDNRYLPY